MHFLTPTFLLLASASLSRALPTQLTNFFLVTTDQSEPSSNSSELRGVSATTPYAEDPVTSSYLLLRLTPAGYNSLPNFTLSTATNTLSTLTNGPHGSAKIAYNSTAIGEGEELQFVAQPQTEGNIGLDEGYLLTVGGEKEGWTICDSVTGPDVLYWKGTGETCRNTFLQAVVRPPYKKT